MVTNQILFGVHQRHRPRATAMGVILEQPTADPWSGSCPGGESAVCLLVAVFVNLSRQQARHGHGLLTRPLDVGRTATGTGHEDPRPGSRKRCIGAGRGKVTELVKVQAYNLGQRTMRIGGRQTNGQHNTIELERLRSFLNAPDGGKDEDR